jgi:drug/metabolite transporter (DMT)-like permease
VAVILALITAVVYGIADYSGGRASRTASSASVTLVGQSLSFAVIICLVIILGDPIASTHDLVVSAIAGVGGSLGLLAFYKAMASGAMTVVAPITAIVGTIVPVMWGLASGERPGVIAYFGMAVAILAVALVTDAFGIHDVKTPLPIVAMAVTGGLCFAVIFIALDYTSPDAGLWPLLALRSVSVPLILVVVLCSKKALVLRGASLKFALLSGLLDSVANGSYLFASRHGLLSVVAVISSLYPVSTLLLATTLDKEHLHRAQWIGVGCAVMALVLVSAG